MTWFATALAAIAAIAATQRPVPPINYSLPGQGPGAPTAPVAIPADAEFMTFRSEAVITRPSASARHFLLAARPPIPPGGVPFSVRCLVDRTNGRVTHCQDPAVADPYRATAIALGSLYQFRLTPAQAAPGPRALAVTIADRIMPADVRPPAQRFEFTQRPIGSVTFAEVMSGEQSRAYYPRDALAVGLEGRFRLDCQVQPDLSIFCLNPAAATGTDPGPLLAQFQLAALQLSAWLRAAPTLSNNAPSPGTIFRTTIVFRAPAE